MRSMLFVPADSERKMAKALGTPADALIFDLEDAVLPSRKAEGRQTLVSFLAGRDPSPRYWIRINGPETPELLQDLAAVTRLAPAGIVLPKLRGPEDLLRVDHYLAMAEALHGLAAESVRIVAVCTETPECVLRMGELAQVRCPRLAGLMWGGEDLSSALGAASPRNPDGSWRSVYAHARAQCLLAAHALSVMAIDTVYVDIRDSDGCARSATQARADGFTGKIAVHPDQVDVINAAFTPSPEELERATRIIAAFAGGAGAIQFEGQMLDVPHLKAARRLLGLGAA